MVPVEPLTMDATSVVTNLIGQQNPSYVARISTIVQVVVRDPPNVHPVKLITELQTSPVVPLLTLPVM